jgi:hypothetical protein
MERARKERENYGIDRKGRSGLSQQNAEPALGCVYVVSLVLELEHQHNENARKEEN